MSRLKELYREHYQIRDEKEFIESKIKEPITTRKNSTFAQGISVKGVDNIKVRFAKCCNPVPGDEIIGYITRGRGVSIHRKDCPNISFIEGNERFVEVFWDTDEKAEYPAEIQIKGKIDLDYLLKLLKELLKLNFLYCL